MRFPCSYKPQNRWMHTAHYCTTVNNIPLLDVIQMMPYQASTVLDLSSLFPAEPSPHHPTTQPTPHHHCHSKTILSRAWKKRVKNTRRLAPAKKTILSPSGTTGRPKRPKNGKNRPQCYNKDETKELNTNQTGTKSGQTETKRDYSRPERTTENRNTVPNQTTTTANKRAPRKTKRRRQRYYVIPPGLRRRSTTKTTTTTHKLKKSLTLCNSSILTPRNYPECILSRQHIPAQRREKVLSLLPSYSRSPDQSVAEDILTRLVTV